MSDGLTDGQSVWVYSSTASCTEIAATGFFTDTKSYGMKVGDPLMNIRTSDGAVTWHSVTASTAANTGYNPPYNITVGAGST
jgi:hypothetical protein